MSRVDITASPSEIEIGGQVYRISPLRDRDFGEFERWVQDRYLDVARRNLEGLNETDKVTLLKCAYEKAASLSISSPESLKLMTTIDGAAMLMYLSLRREQPDITYNKAIELTTDAKMVKFCMDKIQTLNTPLKTSAAKANSKSAKGLKKKYKRHGGRA
jgi:hypothetical protein